MDVRPATLDDIDAYVSVLAHSFHDDPGIVLFEPDPLRRAAILPPFFRAFTAASLSEGGGLMVAGDPVQGVASWFGPDAYGPSPDAMGANGFGGVLEQAGEEAAGRLLAIIGELEGQHARLVSGPHFRLQFFGVEPAQQGKGVGSALIEHGHIHADAAGLPCYLDTFTEENVRYYEKRGYGIVSEFSVGDGVPVYGMVRPAQAA
jgi:ribosomal protein S18 acetylase RimI-like enzyme